MEDSKSQESNDEVLKNITGNENLEVKIKESKTISDINDEQNKSLKIKQNKNRIYEENNLITEDKIIDDNKKVKKVSKLNLNIDKNNNNNEKSNHKTIDEEISEDYKVETAKPKSDIAINKSEVSLDKDNKVIAKEKSLEEIKTVNLTSKSNENLVKSDNRIINKKTTEDNLDFVKNNSDKSTNRSATNVDKVNKAITKDKSLEENKIVNLTAKSNEIGNKIETKGTSTPIPVKPKTKPVKEPPIEKKPFLEFVNDYLIPEIKNEFKLKGKEINKINLQKTHRPIAEDMCWVIYCEIKDTCNFWLSFEKDDITSLKSFSLCKNYEKPSIIESFLIDEKKITLKLIISRILQRLNGQKLIGAN